MSYTKHTWATGNVVGAVDLNRMEQGIEDAGSSGSSEVLVISSSENDGIITLDKTWQEIYDAFPLVTIMTFDDNYLNKTIIFNVGNVDSNYFVNITGTMYETDSASGYPMTTVK